MIPLETMVSSGKVGLILKVKDWFHKEPLNLDINELRSKVLPLLDRESWSDCHYSQAPGSKWILLNFEQPLLESIEKATGLNIYPDFYIWNYFNVKKLKVHRDTNDWGEFRQIAGSIPLVGEFEIQVYNEDDFNKPFDSCVYGPGDFLLLNNTKYYHGGKVLSDTRISMHFYFDAHNQENLSLEDFLNRNRDS